MYSYAYINVCNQEFIGADGEETDKDTIVFHFDVECVDQLSGEVKVLTSMQSYIHAYIHTVAHSP